MHPSPKWPQNWTGIGYCTMPKPLARWCKLCGKPYKGEDDWFAPITREGQVLICPLCWREKDYVPNKIREWSAIEDRTITITPMTNN